MDTAVEKILDLIVELTLGEKPVKKSNDTVMLTKLPFVILSHKENSDNNSTHIELTLETEIITNIEDNIIFLKLIICIAGIMYINKITRNNYKNSRVFNYLNSETYQETDDVTDNSLENSLRGLNIIFEFFILVGKFLLLFLVILFINSIYNKFSGKSIAEENTHIVMSFHIIYQLTCEKNENGTFYHYKIGTTRWNGRGFNTKSVTFSFCRLEDEYKILFEKKEIKLEELNYTQDSVSELIKQIESRNYNSALLNIVFAICGMFANDDLFGRDKTTYNLFAGFHGQLNTTKRDYDGKPEYIVTIYNRELENKFTSEAGGTKNPVF